MLSHRFSVAPMMDWTDRHCRAFHRVLSKRTRLYTEMVTADAVLHGDRTRLLGFDESEHPVALQLGGADPEKLAEAARIGADFGYDEINLNVGCPSDRVQSGTFGACLMAQPKLVANCMVKMRQAVGVPVTVKCRIGIDDQTPEETLPDFIGHMADAGVETVIVHARKAWLKGLSPKQNREIPPLDYALVYKIKDLFDRTQIIINGGIANLDAVEGHLSHVDGVMMGREAYHNPGMLLEVDERVFACPPSSVTAADAVRAYFPYMEKQLRLGVRLSSMTRHMLGMFAGQRGAKRWRRILTEDVRAPGAGVETVERALTYIGNHEHSMNRLEGTI